MSCGRAVGVERVVLLLLTVAVVLKSTAQAPSLLSLSGAHQGSNERANDALAQARRLIETGRASEAESLLRQKLLTDPGSPEVNKELAYCLLREDKPADALKQYTVAAALNSPDAEELVNVGQAYILLGDTVDADRWTLRAVRMSPADAEAWYSLGRIRYTEQRFSEALSCFQRALTLNPHNPKVENNIGVAEEGLNHPEDAADAYHQAIAWQAAQPLRLGSEQPYLNLAIILLHRGELAEAARLLSTAMRISPQDPRIYEQLGHLRLQSGDPNGAADAFGAAVRLDPKDRGLHFLLGQAYRRLGEADQAQAQFAEAERLSHGANAAKP